MPQATDAAEASLRNLRPGWGRKRKVGVVSVGFVVTVAIFGAGWVAASTFESPEQRAARANAPAPAPVTAEVDRGALKETISAAVTVSRYAKQTIALSLADANSVVTRQPLTTGQRINVGAPVLEVNGRPLIAMPGKFPFYRPLSLGSEGPDVTQLQEGLLAAGYQLKIDGKFGPGTASALRNLYKKQNYSLGAFAQTGQGNGGQGENTAPHPSLVIPTSDLLVFNSLPAYIVTSPSVGTTLDGQSAITVESGEAVAIAEVPANIANRLKPGMNTTLAGADGTELEATVSSVRAPDLERVGNPPTAGTAESNDALLVLFATAEGTLPPGWLHTEAVAVVTIDVASSNSLIVPSIAVIAEGRDRAHVLKLLEDGSFEVVPVVETATLAGRSAVKTTTDNSLALGDRVRID